MPYIDVVNETLEYFIANGVQKLSLNGYIGHDTDGAELSVASEHPGVNSNLLADEQLVEPLTGNAVLNGIPVELAPVRHAASVPA